MEFRLNEIKYVKGKELFNALAKEPASVEIEVGVSSTARVHVYNQYNSRSFRAIRIVESHDSEELNVELSESQFRSLMDDCIKFKKDEDDKAAEKAKLNIADTSTPQ
tara:strand:+ start:433 stop:753 length:321 start_codon:yes stop_codon:yes gene_type:complete